MQTEFVLERSMLIRAERETVFRFFTDSALFARWWGDGSAIDPRPGGTVLICYPNRIVARGEVVEVEPPARIIFTYGYESGRPIGPGESRVMIRLEAELGGTRVLLHHAFSSAATRDAHDAGWRYQLARFADVATAEQHCALEAIADRWFDAWANADADVRREALTACTTEDVEFRDATGCTAGRGELDAHIAAIQVHMPDVRMTRSGSPRQCQGIALVDWTAGGAGSGTNVLELAPDGRIARVTGVCGP